MLANTPNRPISATSSVPRTAAPRRPLGLLFLLQFGVFAVTLVVLGGAIGWPASLDDPPATMLPLLVAQRGAVALGYSCYLASALLLIPIAVVVRRLTMATEAQLPAIAATLGVLAGLCKTFGILRWLTAMPTLAGLYGDPTSGQATRDAIAVVYIALNNYAGGIGELLGVDILAGLWTCFVALTIIRRGAAPLPLPTWLGWFGLLAGASLLIGAVELVGLDLGSLTLTFSGVVWQLWMIAMGLMLLFRRHNA